MVVWANYKSASPLWGRDSPAPFPLEPTEDYSTFQPPTLIVWGKYDKIFPAAGAHPYRRDFKDVELRYLDTGHFALEENGATIARP